MIHWHLIMSCSISSFCTCQLLLHNYLFPIIERKSKICTESRLIQSCNLHVFPSRASYLLHFLDSVLRVLCNLFINSRRHNLRLHNTYVARFLFSSYEMQTLKQWLVHISQDSKLLWDLSQGASVPKLRSETNRTKVSPKNLLM